MLVKTVITGAIALGSLMVNAAPHGKKHFLEAAPLKGIPYIEEQALIAIIDSAKHDVEAAIAKWATKADQYIFEMLGCAANHIDPENEGKRVATPKDIALSVIIMRDQLSKDAEHMADDIMDVMAEHTIDQAIVKGADASGWRDFFKNGTDPKGIISTINATST